MENGKKKQTIRPVPKKNVPKAGDEISLREWSGKPYRSKQRELCRSTVTKVERVLIHPDGILIDGVRIGEGSLFAFAVADGFTSSVEMLNWFQSTHGLPFTGIAIHWK